MDETTIPLSSAKDTPTPEQTARYEASRVMLRALYRADQYEIHDKVLMFHDELKAKYSDARDYLMFHLISGSTFHGFNGKVDFHGDDSVERFIEREYKEVFFRKSA